METFAVAAEKIITSLEPLTSCRILVIRDGRVADSGMSDGLAGGCRVIDLGEAFVVPGFIDAHSHFALSAFKALWHDLRNCAYGDIPRPAPGDWIRCRQPPHWGTHLSLLELDLLFPHNPAIILEQGYHGCALNTAGRRAILGDPGGERFAQLLQSRATHGHATFNDQEPGDTRPEADSSALFEGASGWAENVSRDWFQENYHDAILEGLSSACQEYLAVGVTYLCDAAVTPRLEALLANGKKHGRIPLGIQPLDVGSTGLFEPPRDRLDLSQPRSLSRDQNPTIKLFIDGGRQCYVKGQYAQARGWRYYDEPDLRQLAAECFRQGYDLALHTMGDAALELGLAVVASLQRTRGSRSVRFEHAALTTSSTRRLLARTDAYAVVSPHWLRWLGPRWLTAPHPGVSFLALASLRDAGVLLAAGSDSTDGEIASPLAGIAAAVSRSLSDGSLLDPEEAITPIEAVALYTQSAAQVCGVSGSRGRLLPGMAADFTVLSGDPLSRAEILRGDIEVTSTWIAGVMRHGSIQTT